MGQREKVNKNKSKRKVGRKSRAVKVGPSTRQEASLAINRRKQKVKHRKSKHPNGSKINKLRKCRAESLGQQTRQMGSKLSNKQEEAKGKAQEV